MRPGLLSSVLWILLVQGHGTAQHGPEGSRPEAQKTCPTLTIDGSTKWVDCKLVPKPAAATVTPSATPANPARPQPDIAVPADSELVKAYLEEERARFQYGAANWEHRRRVFAWQHDSTIIIFWIVVVLVLSGLVLAALQFWEANRAQMVRTRLAAEIPRTAAAGSSTTPADGTPAAGDASGTTFEASLSGIKISSSVIGLIVLAMSLGFFYLYLKFVYPIQPVGGPATTQTESADRK